MVTARDLFNWTNPATTFITFCGMHGITATVLEAKTYPHLALTLTVIEAEKRAGIVPAGKQWRRKLNDKEAKK